MSPAELQRRFQLAAEHFHTGRPEEAESFCRALLKHLPDNFELLQLSGAVALRLGRTDEAVAWLSRAQAMNPRSAPGAMRLGVALTAAGRATEAAPHCRRATELDPSSAEAWTNLALCLQALDRPREALEFHHRAVTLRPTFAAGWHHYGMCLALFGRFQEALLAHERALAADPRFSKGHYGRAQALQRLHRLPEAVAAYDRFLEAEPAGHEARSYRLLALSHLDTLSRERLFEEHQLFGRAVGEHPRPGFANNRDPERRLRVGLLSPDLRAHSCAYFLEPLLRHLDPEQFEILLYHDHVREDDVSVRLRRLASHWRNVSGQPNAAVEKIIRTDAPDLLIDLAGHSGATNRLALFARHLAPVQINYLGYPDTTGLPAMRHRFTDATADPEGEADAFATEKLVRFAPTAWAYQPPENTPATGAPPAAAGAPITFGCFNNPGKITLTTAALWARALEATPGSRLFLKGHGFADESTRRRFLALLADAGLPRERVELADHTSDITSHLACYHRVDIALDTFPYHGTTTTCEALWMGVPVVTLRGDRHAARVSASLLTASGHPEWIAATATDFARIAADLAREPARLADLRARLRDDLRASPLLDHAGQATRFGAALRQCWREYCHSPVGA